MYQFKHRVVRRHEDGRNAGHLRERAACTMTDERESSFPSELRDVRMRTERDREDLVIRHDHVR